MASILGYSTPRLPQPAPPTLVIKISRGSSNTLLLAKTVSSVVITPYHNLTPDTWFAKLNRLPAERLPIAFLLVGAKDIELFLVAQVS